MRIPYNISHGIKRFRFHCRRPLNANKSVTKATGEKIEIKIPEKEEFIENIDTNVFFLLCHRESSVQKLQKRWQKKTKKNGKCNK